MTIIITVQIWKNKMTLHHPTLVFPSFSFPLFIIYLFFTSGTDSPSRLYLRASFYLQQLLQSRASLTQTNNTPPTLFSSSLHVSPLSESEVGLLLSHYYSYLLILSYPFLFFLYLSYLSYSFLFISWKPFSQNLHCGVQNAFNNLLKILFPLVALSPLWLLQYVFNLSLHFIIC